MAFNRLGFQLVRGGLYWSFYHRWSKLGRIVNLDPNLYEAKKTKILKEKMLKGPFFGAQFTKSSSLFH